MANVLSAFWNLITAVAPEIQIRNTTDKHIILIPLSCLDGDDFRKNGIVKHPDELVKVIPPKETIEVAICKYDNNPVNPNSQIYILFRAGTKAYVEKLREDLLKKPPQAVEVQKGEVLFFHFHLLKFPKFSLKCNTKGQVIREVDNADQKDATGNESQVQTIIERLKNWKKNAAKDKDLKNGGKTVNEGSTK